MGLEFVGFTNEVLTHFRPSLWAPNHEDSLNQDAAAGFGDNPKLIESNVREGKWLVGMRDKPFLSDCHGIGSFTPCALIERTALLSS
uniref:Uncharacterized protein n=1 Tax=Salix viminalis TaxID=40686 RepID=A0A6N2KBW9_SALVM